MAKPTYIGGITQVKAYRILQAQVASLLATVHINPTQWFILGLIRNNGQIRLLDIAKNLGVEAPLITLHADTLTRQGLVERKPHEQDRRSKLLFLTPKGHELVNTVETQLQEHLDLLLRDIPAADLDAYDRVLQSIIRNGTALENHIHTPLRKKPDLEL